MEDNLILNKIDNIEKRVDKLEKVVELNTNNINLTNNNETSNRKDFERVFGSLINITNNIEKVSDSLVINLEKTTETEHKVENLKTVTDKLTIDVKEANDQIKTIQEAPIKTYTALKNTVYGCIISVIVGALIGHFIGAILLLL